jgi:1,2-diacylglycerol 3-beta-galactosyltransferase
MSDTGGGHRSAAEAIAEALYRSRTRVSIEFLDFFAECAPFPLNRAGKIYGPWVNYAAWLWATLFHATNGVHRAAPGLWLLTRLLRDCVARRVQAFKPDLLVSVHPLVNHLAAHVRDAVAPSTPLITVVTDLVSAHVAWFCPAVDLCIVPTEGAYHRAIDAGMPRDKLRVIGLPVHPRFAEVTRSPQEIRRELGLTPERFTVLLVGGGEGMGRVYEMACAVAQTGDGLQQIIIAGRNTRLRERLEARRWEIPTRIFGFVDNMPTLLQAADVVVTKAGPSTICESLVIGKPLLLFGYVPGQEQGNVEFVVESGAGWLVETPDALINALRELTQPGSPVRAQMMENARRLARPSAANDIAQVLVNLVTSTLHGSETRCNGLKSVVK